MFLLIFIKFFSLFFSLFPVPLSVGALKQQRRHFVNREHPYQRAGALS